jgi:hypothetical protein
LCVREGRIERLWGTLQDRWVKELRLARVSTLEQANALMDEKLNREFLCRLGTDIHGDVGGVSGVADSFLRS